MKNKKKNPFHIAKGYFYITLVAGSIGFIGTIGLGNLLLSNAKTYSKRIYIIENLQFNKIEQVDTLKEIATLLKQEQMFWLIAFTSLIFLFVIFSFSCCIGFLK